MTSLDFSRKPKAPDITSLITEAIDTAIVERQRAEYESGRGSGQGDVAKHRIGAGYIGDPCARALAFRYHKAPKEERESVVSPGELQRHALVGFWTEESIAEWLRLAGFDIRTHKPDADGNPTEEQYGYKAARHPESGQARLAGEIDGVILASPIKELPTPCLWESKKATDKKWKAFKKEGVKKADPKYYGQVQTNMAYLEVETTLFTMLNLDNMKFYMEIISFDLDEAQRLTDRALEVMETRSPDEMPRIATEPSDFRCKFCDYATACWRESTAVAAPNSLEKPNWLTGV